MVQGLRDAQAARASDAILANPVLPDEVLEGKGFSGCLISGYDQMVQGLRDAQKLQTEYDQMVQGLRDAQALFAKIFSCFKILILSRPGRNRSP